MPSGDLHAESRRERAAARNWVLLRVPGVPLPVERSSSASGRRGSNPRHQAWKACALPAELLPRNLFEPLLLARHRRRQAPISGGGRIRTFVGVKPADLQSAPVGRLGTPPIP